MFGTIKKNADLFVTLKSNIKINKLRLARFGQIQLNKSNKNYNFESNLHDYFLFRLSVLPLLSLWSFIKLLVCFESVCWLSENLKMCAAALRHFKIYSGLSIPSFLWGPMYSQHLNTGLVRILNEEKSSGWWMVWYK